MTAFIELIKHREKAFEIPLSTKKAINGTQERFGFNSEEQTLQYLIELGINHQLVLQELQIPPGDYDYVHVSDANEISYKNISPDQFFKFTFFTLVLSNSPLHAVINSNVTLIRAPITPNNKKIFLERGLLTQALLLTQGNPGTYRGFQFKESRQIILGNNQ